MIDLAEAVQELLKALSNYEKHHLISESGYWGVREAKIDVISALHKLEKERKNDR
jgi:hypothetical protein